MSYTSTPKRYKAKKAKDWQKVQFQAEKRIQKGEQKRFTSSSIRVEWPT